MKPLVLVRARYLEKCVDVLDEIGAPSSAALRQFHLPSHVDGRMDCYIPAANGIGFMRLMEWQNGIDDLGCAVAERLVLGDLHEEVSAHIAAAPTLHGALGSLVAFCHREYTRARFWSVPVGDTVRVCSSIGIPGATPGLHFLEWLQNMAVVLAVRAFAEPAWRPAEMGFQSRIARSATARKRFPHTRLTSGHGCAFVTIPRSLLSQSASVHRPSMPADSSSTPAKPDFSASLKLLLRSYINSDVRLSLHDIAGIIGSSARNLQRQLARTGRTYRDIRAEVRFETAMCLMQNPDTRIIDIAYATGYDDPSHFTRAFRRYTGVSPREYRASHCARVLKPTPVRLTGPRHSNPARTSAT